MVTLTKAAVTSRKAIRYGIYFIVAFFILRFTATSLIGLYKKAFPPKAPPPSVKYGTLPELPFPDQEASNLTYELEFLNEVEKFPTQTEVYFIPKPTTNLLALDNAKQKASDMGFTSNGRELVETIYSFVSPDLLSTLNMNIVTNAFSIVYDIDSNPRILDYRAPSFEVAESTVKGQLQEAQLLPEDLLNGRSENQYLRKSGSNFVPALSQSDSNVTKINLYRKGYGTMEMPSVTDDPNESNVWFIVASPSVVVAAEYHYFPLDPKEFATYPIKTLEEAWQDLLNGKAYIARRENESEQVLVTNAYLAYYDPSQYTEFYQPVIVFENEEGFRAYVPAITNEFYGATEGETTPAE